MQVHNQIQIRILRFKTRKKKEKRKTKEKREGEVGFGSGPVTAHPRPCVHRSTELAPTHWGCLTHGAHVSVNNVVRLICRWDPVVIPRAHCSTEAKITGRNWETERPICARAKHLGHAWHSVLYHAVLIKTPCIDRLATPT